MAELQTTTRDRCPLPLHTESSRPPSKAERAARQPQLNPLPPHRRALTTRSHSARPPVSCRNIKGEVNQPLGRPRPVRLQSRRASLARLASAADAGLTLLVSAGFAPGYGPPGEVPHRSAVTRLSAAHTASLLRRELRGVARLAKKRREPQESWPLAWPPSGIESRHSQAGDIKVSHAWGRHRATAQSQPPDTQGTGDEPFGNTAIGLGVNCAAGLAGHDAQTRGAPQGCLEGASDPQSAFKHLQHLRLGAGGSTRGKRAPAPGTPSACRHACRTGESRRRCVTDIPYNDGPR